MTVVKTEDYPLHLTEVRAHFGALMAGGWVAVVLLLVAIFALADQLTRPALWREVWPDDTPITASDALRLEPEELDELDTALLGSAGRAPQQPLEHLPPIPPSVSPSGLGYRGGPRNANGGLWQGTREVSPRSEPLQRMAQCMARARCAPDEIEALGRAALPVIGTPDATTPVDPAQPGAQAGSCAYAPRAEEHNTRVPTGLLAIVMGWVPECHGAAKKMFQRFGQTLTWNLAPDMPVGPAPDLTPEQVTEGELYARFQLAKLTDHGSLSDTSRFASDMTGVIAQLQRVPSLQQAYAQAADVPALGLSMAEIRAEWLYAQARLLAQEVSPAQLGRQMQMAGLFDPEISLQPSTAMDRGRSQLQLVWCALALRAGPDARISEQAAGGSPLCLARLLEQRAALPAALVCALQVRLALRHGRWSPPECDSLENPAADPRRFMQHMAQSPAIWRDAFKTYAALPATSARGLKLRRYLDAYALPSGNRWVWMAHEHRAALAGLALALILPVSVAAYLCWVWQRQLPALQRVLSPRIELDA